MLKISFADCLGLSLNISSQFISEMYAAASIAKITENSYFFWGGGSIRSKSLTCIVLYATRGNFVTSAC